MMGTKARFTQGPWFKIGTPGYLMMLQRADGDDAREIDPITIASRAHTEEIATVWNYLLPTEANANLIIASPEMYRLLANAPLPPDGFLEGAALKYWLNQYMLWHMDAQAVLASVDKEETDE